MTWDGIWTQAEVVERLPEWMWFDFDCPVRGAHDFRLRTTSRGVRYEWCRHCHRLKRILDPCPDTRDPLEVIYALQFSR